MINLTVNDQAVVLPVDATISIEKNSPVLNEEVGSFSYPFPVSTEKNRAILGYPGRLERAGDIATKTFVLQDNGIQILAGETDIDSVTALETGLVLLSGNTEFSHKMDGKLLSDLDFGLEPFPGSGIVSNPPEEITDLLNLFTAANTSGNGMYVCAPFVVKDTQGDDIIINPTNVSSAISTAVTTETYRTDHYGLQFFVSFILSQIYKNAGLRIVENQLTGSVFNDVVLFSKVLTVRHKVMYESNYARTVDRVTSPRGATLKLADLMPDEPVLDFIENIKNMLCLAIEINEQTRSVSIFFKKEIFSDLNRITLADVELSGWEHQETQGKDGFRLKYQTQDDELALEYDYAITDTIAGIINLPEPTDQEYRNTVVLDALTNREYRLTENTDDWSWKQIGRLKPYRLAGGEEEFDIKVKIPYQMDIHVNVTDITANLPFVNLSVEKNTDPFKNISPFLNIEFYVSIWRGMTSYGSKTFPTITFDYSLLNSNVFTTSLKPDYLYETVYKEFINWQTYQARECTKYLKLSLIEAMQLQWRKRYVISGVPILLNQVSFEVPYTGIVKINGFTA